MTYPHFVLIVIFALVAVGLVRLLLGDRRRPE